MTRIPSHLRHPRRSRRAARPAVALLAALALATAGCADDAEETDTASPWASSAAPSPTASQDAVEDRGGGATVTHRFGETTVAANPTRIVALSSIDADTAAALGQPPLLTPDTYGVGSVPPWLADASGDQAPEFLGSSAADLSANNLPYEQIAATDPDVILGMNSGIDEAAYNKLSAIAPTVAPQIGDYLDAWQDVTRTIGTAMSQEERAEELVTEAEKAISDAAAANPEFAGATFVTSLLISTDQFGVLVDDRESTVSLMKGLGFELKPEVDALEATTGYAAQVSRERTSLLDADVAVVYAMDPEVYDDYRNDPLFTRLDVVQRDALIEPDKLLWFSVRNPSVLTIPYAIEQVVPKLAELDLGDDQ